MAEQQDDEIETYEKGQTIFSQGEPGGDLFLIKEGEVEIYSFFGGHEVSLAIMNAGEILGTLTLMTKEMRMASARAYTKAVVQHISRQKIEALIANLPKWMHIVLDDFTKRLKSMNERYAKSLQNLKEAESNQVNIFYTAAQVAGLIAGCAEAKKGSFDGNPGIMQQDILEYIEPMLQRERAELDMIFQTFIDSGMITLKIEKEKKRNYVSLENAVAIGGFPQFVRDAQSGKLRDLLGAKFRKKDLRVIASLTRYCQAKKLDMTKVVKIRQGELKTNLSKVTGQSFSPESITQAESLKLVTLEGEGPQLMVVFQPDVLGQTLAHLRCYQMFEKGA